LILAMQETLVAVRHYPIVMKGYRTFAKPWEKGFRGQAILVDNRLSAYEVQHKDDKHIIHIKVSGLPNHDKPAHVLSIYIPSGGNFRGERTRLIKAMGKMVEKILEGDKDALIIGMGDFNTETEDLDKKLRLMARGITRISGVGSMWSRFPKNKVTPPKSIDHFVGSQVTNLLWKKARVLRDYPISDHRPIMLKMRTEIRAPESTEKTVKVRVNVDRCRQKGEQLVMHNRWSVLANEGEQEENLETIVEKFSEILEGVTKKLGIRESVGDHKRHLPRKLKEALQKYKKLGKKFAKETEKGEDTQMLLRQDSGK
jgi:exonuclease III